MDTKDKIYGSDILLGNVDPDDLMLDDDFPDLMCFSTSSLVTRPPLPVPLIAAASIPFSDSNRRTEGLNASLSSVATSAGLSAAGAGAATAPSTSFPINSSFTDV